jgi:hypothetical protein
MYSNVLGSDPDVYAELARQHVHKELMRTLSIRVRQELMRALSIRVRNLSMHLASLQELMRAQSAGSSKHAEHTHQELMRTLSIRVRN